MSMVYILNHEESIYNVEEKEKAALEKPPMYHSKFGQQVRNERKALKDNHRTMGYAEIPLKKTSEFLKKDGGVRPKTGIPGHLCNLKISKPPIPKHDEAYEKITSDVNFKTRNIKRVISAAPRKPKPKYADTKNGDFHDLKSSGLMPVYIYQPKFGKLPGYLMKRMRDVALQQELLRDEDARKQPQCRYITQEERAELIGGLKHNWEKLQIDYQALPVLTDTIPKMIRKTKMENDLKQLEKDILLVENHPYIYIYKNKE